MVGTAAGFSFSRGEYLRDTVLMVQSPEGMQELALPVVDLEASSTFCVRWGPSTAFPASVFGTPVIERNLGILNLGNGAIGRFRFASKSRPVQPIPLPGLGSVPARLSIFQQPVDTHPAPAPWKAHLLVDLCLGGEVRADDAVGSSILAPFGDQGLLFANARALSERHAGGSLFTSDGAQVTTTELFDEVVSEGLVAPCFGLRKGVHRVVAIPDAEGMPPLPLGRMTRDLGTLQLSPDADGFVDVLHQATFLRPIEREPAAGRRLFVGHGGRFWLRVFITGAEAMPGFLANIVIQPSDTTLISEPIVVGDPFMDYASLDGFAEALIDLRATE